MDLTRYVDDLQRQLATAAAAGGDDAREVAERLSGPLDAATRLVLLEALSMAAGEITRQLAPGAVDVLLRGREPHFVVTMPPADDADHESTTPAPAPAAAPAAPPAAATDLDDVSTSRTTLRLPDHLKSRVEDAAAADGLSLNAWLVRAIADALDATPRRQAQRARRGDSLTGWAR